MFSTTCLHIYTKELIFDVCASSLLLSTLSNIRLYTNKQTPKPSKETVLSRLKSATVAVIGLGGVGSWAAEALARSGIGNIILIDLDDICISNTNRQLHAMQSTVGKMKIDEMKRRLVDIHPGCNVTLIHDFVSL